MNQRREQVLQMVGVGLDWLAHALKRAGEALEHVSESVQSDEPPVAPTEPTGPSGPTGSTGPYPTPPGANGPYDSPSGPQNP